MRDSYWTEFVRTCDGCTRRFRVSRFALVDAIREYGRAEEAAEQISICHRCACGTPLPGEYNVPSRLDEHDGRYQLTDMTSRVLFAIHLGLVVASSIDDGNDALRDALAHVQPAIDALRARGISPTKQDAKESCRLIVARGWSVIDTSTEHDQREVVTYASPPCRAFSQADGGSE
jgi:hypothetical protein